MAHMAAVILAAGKGTRMMSSLPKVLHQVCGKPMISHVISAAYQSGIKEIILVVGHESEEIMTFLDTQEVQSNYSRKYVKQIPQLGTGHALQQAMPAIDSDNQTVLVLCGDTPLLTMQSLCQLRDHFELTQAACTVLSACLSHPTGYGRLIRKQDGSLSKIVEEKDANQEEKTVMEINTGTYCFRMDALSQVIHSLKSNNAQGEYYLTDVIEALVARDCLVNAMVVPDAEEIMGVNDRKQLAFAAEVLRCRKNEALMLSGVTIVDPATTYIDCDVAIKPDTVIEPQTILKGKTKIGSGCIIGPATEITDCMIGCNCQIKHSVLWEATVGDDCPIGPFAYLRPGTVLSDKVKIGDFVEVKNSIVGEGSKIPHLSYVGDSQIGKKVNVGCGTITCNYDGFAKYPTVIEDGVFIGSNTSLVAPIKVGKDALVAAGSTLTQDVPANALSFGRAKQKNIEGGAPKWREDKTKEK